MCNHRPPPQPTAEVHYLVCVEDAVSLDEWVRTFTIAKDNGPNARSEFGTAVTDATEVTDATDATDATGWTVASSVLPPPAHPPPAGGGGHFGGGLPHGGEIAEIAATCGPDAGSLGINLVDLPNGHVGITSIVEGSPAAQQFHLRAGLLIETVQGRPVQGLTVEDVVLLMRQRPVTITFHDPDAAHSLPPPPPPLGSPPLGYGGSGAGGGGGGGGGGNVAELHRLLELERHDNGEAIAHIGELEHRLAATEGKLAEAEAALHAAGAVHGDLTKSQHDGLNAQQAALELERQGRLELGKRLRIMMGQMADMANVNLQLQAEISSLRAGQPYAAQQMAPAPAPIVPPNFAQSPAPRGPASVTSASGYPPIRSGSGAPPALVRTQSGLAAHGTGGDAMKEAAMRRAALNNALQTASSGAGPVGTQRPS
eukprot:SAG22_NODE_2730_length_2275_cov_2.575827_2_plen_426_part_00